MGKKILIDAAHPEETRVVVLKGNKVEDFDFESAAHKQLRGNIYLAKVTRVEPSLQAAFVDYGGNRHGFLAFSEIHPDYYQIPLADRQALLEEEEEDRSRNGDDDEVSGGSAADVPEDPSDEDGVVAEASDDESEDDGEQASAPEAAVADETDASEPQEEASDASAVDPAEDSDDTDTSEADDTDSEDDGPNNIALTAERDDDTLTSDDVTEATDSAEDQDADSDTSSEEEPPADADTVEAEDAESASAEEASASEAENSAEPAETADDEDDDNGNGEKVESVGAEDAMEEVPQRRRKRRRDYKIQEVIKRRQIILVQVVKEERGNKGAALTTYLSMAGRYCVLMPNTSRGGGISRKITDAQDRKRLKEVAGNLEIPQGMGLIVRTAGANRTKAEIKRDYDYLLRLWESVRDLTLQSNAPCLVYEEGSLIKRSIRDLYGKDVDSIVVEGEPAYREAKDLMKMLMPSHAKNVKPHKDSRPLFSRNQIETQLDALYSPQVTLPSGGYIVINQTEALVAVDVNSGKATREHNIENTALATNMEAAEEVARQMRLRDLAGLIVIDFIDMEERRNNRNVERKLKDVLKNDRARIQVGRISHFGLLEMSRQRMRTGVLEGSTLVCHHCEGQGFIRSTESCALSVLRGAEEHLMGRKSPDSITVRCDASTCAYILNQKRDHLHALEAAFDVVIFVEPSGELRGSDYKVEKSEGPTRRPAKHAAVSLISAYEEDEDDDAEEVTEAVTEDTETTGDDDDRPRKRRRRRGRRGGRNRNREEGEGEASQEASSEEDAEETGEGEDGGRKRGRRRRSRGGRKRGGRNAQADTEQAAEAQEIPGTGDQPEVPLGDLEDPWDTTPRKEDAAVEPAAETEPAEAEAAPVVETEEPPAKPKRKSRAKKKAKPAEDDAAEAPAEETAAVETAPAEADAADEKPEEVKKPKKRAARKKKAAAKAKAPAEEQANGSASSENAEEAAAPPPAAEPEPEAVAAAPAVAEETAPPPPPEPDRPKRRGWWQRR